MIRNTLESITGISIYPVFSFVLFLLLFTGMLVWVARRNKQYLHEHRQLPLNDSQPLNPIQHEQETR